MAQGKNAFCASDEYFSAGGESIENERSNFNPPSPHTHTASYQRLSSKTYFKMIATHRYSPSKTGGSYHILILTSEFATLTICIYTIEFSAGLNILQVD